MRNLKAAISTFFVGLVLLALCPVAQAQPPAGRMGGFDAYGNSYMAGNGFVMNLNATSYPGCFAPNSVVTIPIGAAAVIAVPNTCIAGQEVFFNTTGALPTGLTAGTTYYVIAGGLTASGFEVSTSAGGGAVTTSGTQSGVQTASSSYANKQATTFTPAITTLPVPPGVSVPGHCTLIWQGDNTSAAIELGFSLSNATSSATVINTMHYGAAGATLADLQTLVGASSSYATPTAISASTTATAANTSYRADVDFLVYSVGTPTTVTISAESSSASYTVYLMPQSRCNIAQ